MSEISLLCFDGSELKDHERVYSIDRISPDANLNVWKLNKLKQEKLPLMSIIQEILKQPSSLDVSVQVGSEVFDCFMLILQSYSAFFAHQSRHNGVINLSSALISRETFQKIYEWMINPLKEIDRDCLISVLIGAEYLEVELLTQQIWNLIQDGDKFQECEAYLLYLEAKLCGCEKVQDMMRPRVQKFFMTFVSSEEFLLMEPEEITKWLKLDSIGINLEIEVFYVAARWLLHNWDNRQSCVIDLMKLVRFGLVAPWRIVELQMNKNMGRITDILRNEELKRMLQSSLSYSSYLSCFQDDHCEQFTDFLTRFGFERLHPRHTVDSQWQSRYKKSRYTFENFEEYLEYLRVNAFTNWCCKS